jgi:hypothetical protein
MEMGCAQPDFSPDHFIAVFEEPLFLLADAGFGGSFPHLSRLLIRIDIDGEKISSIGMNYVIRRC